MRRVAIAERAGWRDIADAGGFTFHHEGGERYWDERACYLFTLEEIEEENREAFMHAGGEDFAYVPCLNDSPEGMRVIESVVRRELMGWV